jgi:hypothetical protein
MARIEGAHRNAHLARAAEVEMKRETNQQLAVKFASAGLLKSRAIPILGINCECGLRANSHFSTGLQCFP